jgi:DNA primase
LKRSERIKEKISIMSVLSGYGYDVINVEKEQQFRCDLHGDGSDNAPSARAYPESNSWYCFACGKTRDSISTVMEIEGVEFNKACYLLESKYNLTPWVYKKKKDIFEETSQDGVSDIDILKKRTETTISYKMKDIPLEDSLKLWEAFNMLSSHPEPKIGQWKKLYLKVVES